MPIVQDDGDAVCVVATLKDGGEGVCVAELSKVRVLVCVAATVAATVVCVATVALGGARVLLRRLIRV